MAIGSAERFFRENGIAAHQYLPAEAKTLFHEAHRQGALSLQQLQELGEKMKAVATPFEARQCSHYFALDVRKLFEANQPKTGELREAQLLFRTMVQHVEKGPKHVDYSPQDFKDAIETLAPDRIILKPLPSGYVTATLFFRPTSAAKAQNMLDFLNRNKPELQKALHVEYYTQADEEGRKAYFFPLVPLGSQAADWIRELDPTRKRNRTARMFVLPKKK